MRLVGRLFESQSDRARRALDEGGSTRPSACCSSIEMLCAQCSLSSGHVHPPEDEEVRLTGAFGFGGPADGIRSALARWTADGEERVASDPQVAWSD